MYYHECFSNNHPVVFDLDAQWQNITYLKRNSAADDVAAFLQRKCQAFFDVPVGNLRCIVIEAEGSAKLSFHVHFPFIVVNPDVYRTLITTVKCTTSAVADASHKEREIAQCVDANLCSTRKLRMVFSDKYNRDLRSPANRALRLCAAYNAQGQRDSEWTDELQENPREVLSLCSLRRDSGQVQISKLKTRHEEDVCMDGGGVECELPPHKKFRSELCGGAFSPPRSPSSLSSHSSRLLSRAAPISVVDVSTEASSLFTGSSISYDQLVVAIRNETLHELPEAHYKDLGAIARTVAAIRDHVFSSSSASGSMSVESETSVLVHFMNLFCCAVTDQKGGLVYCIRTHCRDASDSPACYQRFHIVQKNNAAFLQYFESIRFPVETSRKGVFGQKTIAQIWLASVLRRNVKRIVFDPNALKINFEPFLEFESTQDAASSAVLRPEFLEAHTHIDLVHTLSNCNANLFDNVAMPIACALKRCLYESDGLDWRVEVEPILYHMKQVWCSGEERLFSFLMGWFKHIIFKPWEKTGVAVVLHGSEGCGKSSVITNLGRGIFGDYFYQITDNEDLTGRFANSMADKLLVFLDEALWGGNKKDAGKVKALLTEKSVRVEFKGVDTYYVDNYSNFIIASNDIWLVPAGANARRWFCLNCSSKYNRNSAYFAKLVHALTANRAFGVAAFVAHLYFNVHLDQFTPHNMPVTELLRIQKEMGLSVMETWWFQVLNRGFVMTQTLYEQLVMSDSLYPHDALKRYAGQAGMFQQNAQRPTSGLVQCIPLEVVFNVYRDEMYGGIKGSAAVAADKDRTSRCIQRFLQQQNVWHELPGVPPSHTNGQWLIFDIQKAKDIWRSRYEDVSLKFNSDRA
jgi:hypothetical protein